MIKAAMLAGLMLAASNAGSQGRAAGEPMRVFFDWGKPEISRDARVTLDEVAASFGQDPRATLQLTGHADRSGAASGNRRSAMRRAEAVRDYLAARGVPRGAMTLVSFGEERPLIVTEDGVREVHNRRVEISFGD